MAITDVEHDAGLGADEIRPAPGDPSIRALLDDERRVVRLEAVHNFRDLGGYTLGDGRVVGWGRLFRADGLHRASAVDVETFDALGLRTVIDLRSSTEASEHGSFPVDRHPVAYHHLPVIDTTWTERELPEVSDDELGTVEFLVWAYREMLAEGADRFAEALHTLAVPASMPAVFHCAAGKDRTGILAMLLLGALGVEHEVIVGDYELTTAAMVRMRTWVEAEHPEMLDRMDDRPQFMFASHPHAMRVIIGDLVAEHGSIEEYVDGLGVGPALLAAIADQLVD